MKKQWAQLIVQYLTFLAAAGRPPTTIKLRRDHLQYMARCLNTPPTQVTSDALLMWFGAQSWKRETRRSYRTTARGFFAWAKDEGYIEVDPALGLPLVRQDLPAPKPAPDTAWTVARVMATTRVTLMLRLAAEAGLRRAEVASVHTNDLQHGPRGAMLVVHGKGSRERIVPISEDLAGLIAAGPAGHTLGMPAHGWLFPGRTNGHLSPTTVGDLVAEVLPGVWTMHSLRHRFATKAYRGSRNLRAVQKLLGHSSIAVTERYTAVDDDEIRQAMEAAIA